MVLVSYTLLALHAATSLALSGENMPSAGCVLVTSLLMLWDSRMQFIFKLLGQSLYRWSLCWGRGSGWLMVRAPCCTGVPLGADSHLVVLACSL